jgi:hypothetical protein
VNAYLLEFFYHHVLAMQMGQRKISVKSDKVLFKEKKERKKN